MKRLLSIFLISAMILTVFLSCANDSPATNTDNANNYPPPDFPNGDSSQEPEDDGGREVIRANLPEADYEGYEFVVVTRDDDWHTYPLHSRDIIAETETGEPINDAVYKRNSNVEEIYNIKIKMINFPERADEMAPNKALINAVNAGDDIYDLIMVHQMFGGATAANGFFYNLYNLPVVDLEQPWWCRGAVEGLSVGNKLFLSLSDFSVSSNDHCYIMLFNKMLHRDYQIEDLYELVRTNQWTFDKLYNITKDISADVNGDGVMDNKDLYGLIEGGGNANWFWAGGNMIMSKDENNRPYLDMPTERMINSFGKALEIFTSPVTFALPHWTNGDIIPMFSNNQGFLVAHQVGTIQLLRDMEVDFGVLPYPKFDTAQEKYYCFLDTHAQLMGVPANKVNIERTGTILEALSYYAYLYQVPAYYDVQLKTKFARDDESSEMLDYIFDGRVFDFGLVYDGNWIISAKFGSLLFDKKDTFVSTIEKTLSPAQKNFDKVLAAYDNID